MILLTLALFALICIVVPVLGIRLLWAQRREETARTTAVQDHPEEYERVPCDLCKGTGSASDLLAPDESRYLGTRCPICYGVGWLMVKKDPEEVRDTPPKATVAASDAPGATPEFFGEVPEDEWRAPRLARLPLRRPPLPPQMGWTTASRPRARARSRARRLMSRTPALGGDRRPSPGPLGRP